MWKDKTFDILLKNNMLQLVVLVCYYNPIIDNSYSR